MHRVFKVVVLIVLAGFLGVFCSAQNILEGEFGAAKREERPPSPPPVQADGNASASVGRTEPKPASGKRYPYHGTVELVDPEGRSITLAGKTRQRVILITSGTNITRNGRRVKLGEALKGERVSGSVIKNEEGREQALTVRLRGFE